MDCHASPLVLSLANAAKLPPGVRRMAEALAYGIGLRGVGRLAAGAWRAASQM
jgi:hypothetical protein